MELSDKKEKWANSRSRYLNGYLLGDSITKNRKAEIYYKGALDKEIDKFIASLIKDLKKVYTPLFNAEKVANAKPSPAQIRILLNQYKGAKLNILIRNSSPNT